MAEPQSCTCPINVRPYEAIGTRLPCPIHPEPDLRNVPLVARIYDDRSVQPIQAARNYAGPGRRWPADG